MMARTVGTTTLLWSRSPDEGRTASLYQAAFPPGYDPASSPSPGSFVVGLTDAQGNKPDFSYLARNVGWRLWSGSRHLQAEHGGGERLMTLREVWGMLPENLRGDAIEEHEHAIDVLATKVQHGVFEGVPLDGGFIPDRPLDEVINHVKDLRRLRKELNAIPGRYGKVRRPHDHSAEKLTVVLASVRGWIDQDCPASGLFFVKQVLDQADAKDE